MSDFNSTVMEALSGSTLMPTRKERPRHLSIRLIHMHLTIATASPPSVQRSPDHNFNHGLHLGFSRSASCTQAHSTAFYTYFSSHPRPVEIASSARNYFRFSSYGVIGDCGEHEVEPPARFRRILVTSLSTLALCFLPLLWLVGVEADRMEPT